MQLKEITKMTSLMKLIIIGLLVSTSSIPRITAQQDSKNEKAAAEESFVKTLTEGAERSLTAKPLFNPIGQAIGETLPSNECLKPEDIEGEKALPVESINSRISRLLHIPGAYRVSVMPAQDGQIFRDEQKRRIRINVRLADAPRTVGRLSLNIASDGCSINKVSFGLINLDSQPPELLLEILNMNAEVLKRAGPDQFLLAEGRLGSSGPFLLNTGRAVLDTAQAWSELQGKAFTTGVSQGKVIYPTKDLHLFRVDKLDLAVDKIKIEELSNVKFGDSTITGEYGELGSKHVYGIYLNTCCGLSLIDNNHSVSERLVVLDQYMERFTDADALSQRK